MERDKYGSQEIDDHHPNSEQEDVHDEKRSIDNRSALDDPAVVVVAQDHPPKKKWPIAFPPFAQCRKPIKSAIAMLIAILMTLSDKCRAAFGQTSLLAAIALVFYSPSRTVGSFMTAQSKKMDSGLTIFLLYVSPLTIGVTTEVDGVQNRISNYQV